MMQNASWLAVVIDQLQSGHSVCRVVLTKIKGSTPREIGADMTITLKQSWGSIGGGQLEHMAMAEARESLGDPEQKRFWRDYPLGPSLGQCCGGFVSLLFEVIHPHALAHWEDIKNAEQKFVLHPYDADLPVISTDDIEDNAFACRVDCPITPLYLYGAGHVGRALINVTHDLPLARHWIDIDPTRFPEVIPEDVDQVIAVNPALIPQHSACGAIHLVMTHSHQVDLDICAAVLKKNNFSQLGLIGSATKRSRFISRLKEMGLDDDALGRLTCPIGLSAIGGKEPFRIALSVAGQIAEWTRKPIYLAEKL